MILQKTEVQTAAILYSPGVDWDGFGFSFELYEPLCLLRYVKNPKEKESEMVMYHSWYFKCQEKEEKFSWIIMSY